MHARQPACNRARPDMSTNCSPHPVLSAFDSLMQCAGRADGFGGDDGAAVGGTGSVPDLSAMRLDSFHEARRATLAYITGDGAAPPSDTSTSGDSGARLLPSSEKRPLHGSPVLPTARPRVSCRTGAGRRMWRPGAVRVRSRWRERDRRGRAGLVHGRGVRLAVGIRKPGAES